MNRYGRNGFGLSSKVRQAAIDDIKESKEDASVVYVENLEAAVILNENDRTVRYKDGLMELVLMTLTEENMIGGEIHGNSDQFLYIVRGRALVSVGKNENDIETKTQLTEGYSIVIPKGKWHEIRNSGDRELKFFSIYTPPEGNE